MEFKDLLQDYDYYCSDNNYYSKDAGMSWDSFQDFYNEYKDADVDMNLIFRWDVRSNEDKSFCMEVFIMQQRKGIFAPHFIQEVRESDFNDIKTLLQPHFDKLTKNWLPFKAL